jgi:hypothetical protein
MRSTVEPMPTTPERAGWRRGAISLRSIPDRAFMGLLDAEDNAWEAYLPLDRRCRPGTKAWEQFVRMTAPERAAFSSYEHRLVEVEGEWWYAERYHTVLDKKETTNLVPATGLAGRLRASDAWADAKRTRSR